MRICVSCMESFVPWSDERCCWKCAPQARRVSLPKPKPSNLILNDGGKCAAGRSREENDCTVRALAIALDVPYERAYGWLARNGRRQNKGCHFEGILRRNNYRFDIAPGYRFERALAIKPARGLRTFLERNPRLRTGVWVLHSTRHASTLIEGKLYDSFDSTRKTFDGAWAVKKGI